MLTDLADLIVGDEPWPIDTDLERVERIRHLTRNDFPFINEGSPALRLRKSRDVDRRNALELLHLFAGSVGSIVWEYPDGSVHYQRYDTRDVPVPGANAYMPPQTIIADAQWAQSTDQLIDRVRVEYGDDPPDGDRPSYVAGDGFHETRLSGEAADIGTATVIGTVVLDRWGRTDVWDAPTINTSTDVLDEETYEALLALLPSDPLETGNLTPAPSPGAGGGGLWFVEGWQETWDRAGTGAPLAHDFTISVSDVRRFAVNGQDISPLILSVSNQSWTIGQAIPPILVTITPDLPPQPSTGVYHLSIDGMEPLPPLALPGGLQANGAATWSLPLDLLPPGKHELRATFTGHPGLYRPAVSDAEVVTVTNAAAFLICLTSPSQRPHVGDAHTLYATLFPKTGDLDENVPEGTVRFESAPAAGGPWTLHEIVDAPGGDDGRTVVSTFTVRAGDVWWRARYIPNPDETRWVTDTSNSIALAPVHAVHKTLTYTGSGMGTYDGAGALVPTEPDLRQGDWGDGAGDYRALIGFVVPAADWTGHVVTKVEVFLQAAEFLNEQGGTIRIGSHQDDPTAILPRTDVRQWPVGTGKWVDISGWGRNLVTGVLRGIAVGPGDGIPGSAALVSAVANPPQIRVTGYLWATGSVTERINP